MKERKKLKYKEGGSEETYAVMLSDDEKISRMTWSSSYEEETSNLNQKMRIFSLEV